MERPASLPLLSYGIRIAALASALVLAACSSDNVPPAPTGGSGGHAGASGGSGGGGRGGTGASGGSAGAAAVGGASGAAGMDAGSPSDAADAAHLDGGDAAADAGNNGAACALASDCTSNFCVDGVCCEAACTGACSACASAKTGQANGLCRPITAGTDPDDECPATAASSCGLDGVCDGTGACRKWGVGTTCVPESCSGSTDTPARTCNGSGTCQTVTNTTCGAYVCGTTSCKTSCTSAADCATGNNCVAGHCSTPQAAGATCGGAGDCVSGNCVDGVCCESACTGSCSACSHVKTGQADGACRPIAAGTDPDGECDQDAASTCGHDGTCDGAGACRLWPANTVCAGGSCSAGTETPARTCDGAGTCLAVSNVSCAGYVCGATGCDVSCGTTADCATGYFCSAGACVAQEANGNACGTASDCASGFCVDGVCCENACQGTCQTCGGVGTLGHCTAAAAGSDPHDDCAPDAVSTCGNDGMCDGSGACRKYAAGTACHAGGCSNATVSSASTCDGAGVCNPGAPTSCNAYQCDQSGVTCGTSCTSDANCTGFCSAAACFTSPVNLAGNGDLEYGTTTGWATFAGGGLVAESATTSAGLVHGGTTSVANTGRTANYQGPAYAMPTGAGVYNISAWAMQNDDATLPAAIQVSMNCGAGLTDFPVIGTYGIALPQGVWTHVTGTVDTSASPGCNPANTTTPGVVNSATLYLNQAGTGTPVAFPNLFLDDVVIQATGGHNLVGNPNFEAGLTSGWQNNGGGTLAVSTTIFNTGTHSLAHTGRTATYNGPHWNLPIGTAKYNVVFNALHDGSLPHDLLLTPTYACAGGATQFGAAIATASQASGNSWNTLTGTVTFPPAGAPAGCKLASAAIYLQQESGTCGTGAGQIECPNLYIDDVSITLAP